MIRSTQTTQLYDSFIFFQPEFFFFTFDLVFQFLEKKETQLKSKKINKERKGQGKKCVCVWGGEEGKQGITFVTAAQVVTQQKKERNKEK